MGWNDFYERQKRLGAWSPDPDSTPECGVTTAGFVNPKKMTEFHRAEEEERRLQKIELDVYIANHKSHTHWWK